MTDDALTQKYSRELVYCTNLLNNLTMRLKKLRNMRGDSLAKEEIKDLEPQAKNLRKKKNYLKSELRKLGWK